MAKFMTVSTYTAQGVKGLLKDGGSSRRAAVDKAMAAMGGRLEGFYFALGEDDVFAISDAPDTAPAAALSLAVSATGLVRTRTVALLTPEEMDAATKKSVAYRGPGQ